MSARKTCDKGECCRRDLQAMLRAGERKETCLTEELEVAKAAFVIVRGREAVIRAALQSLMDCSVAIVGTTTRDNCSQEAIDMFWEARKVARVALRVPKFGGASK